MFRKLGEGARFRNIPDPETGTVGLRNIVPVAPTPERASERVNAMNEKAALPVQSVRDSRIPTAFGRLRDEIDHLFDDFSLPRSMRSAFNLPDGLGLTPAIELRDRKDRYELAVELPGLEEKDIDIELADGVLSISGEKRSESEEKSGDYLVCERSYGSFRRRIDLPADIDPDGIEAKYRRGVLKVDIRKDKQAVERVRKIPVG